MNEQFDLYEIDNHLDQGGHVVPMSICFLDGFPLYLDGRDMGQEITHLIFLALNMKISI